MDGQLPGFVIAAATGQQSHQFRRPLLHAECLQGRDGVVVTECLADQDMLIRHGSNLGHVCDAKDLVMA